MSLVTSNNVQKIIALPVIPADTTITLVDVTGLPDVSDPADWTILTLIRLSDSQQEIVRVDSISGNVLTVQRAQEGTIALSFSASDEARNFFTSGMFDQFTFEADTAVASAAAAAVSETNAATSESNAATSASNASTSETNASTSASNAASSETNAATSASNASTSETNAATSASNASTSETNASTYEAKAQDWAEEAEDVEVETGLYSAKHWAAKAAASAGAAGGILGTGSTSDKTADYTVLAADVTTSDPIVLGSANTAARVFTLDVSLLSDNSKKINFINKSDYRLELVVSNTGTMTFNNVATNRYLWKGEGMITIAGDTATNADIVAGG